MLSLSKAANILSLATRTSPVLQPKSRIGRATAWYTISFVRNKAILKGLALYLGGHVLRFDKSQEFRRHSIRSHYILNGIPVHEIQCRST